MRRVRGACDRCYRLKERCERTSPVASCERCMRFDQVCSSNRPLRLGGRPRLHRKDTLVQSARSCSEKAQLSPFAASLLHADAGLNKSEQELVLLLGTNSSVKQHIVDPRFGDIVKESFVRASPASWSILKDAYFAYAHVLRLIENKHFTDSDAASVSWYCSLAVRALRNIVVTQSDDAKICLNLGYALTVAVYAYVGVGVAEVCRRCLSITKHLVEYDVPLEHEAQSIMSFLASMEITECLLYRRMPTLKLKSSVDGSIDRHLGLCLSLLPYYYDLCVISHCFSKGTNKAQMDMLKLQLREVEAKVNTWQPRQPENLMESYSTIEVVHLLAQARVYRLAALLIVHRIQHPFGEEDAKAEVLSREVLMELHLARHISDQPIRFVTLPFIVAAVELQTSAERDQALQNVNHYVDCFTPVVQKATKAFLSRIWGERDTLPGLFWLDSIHKPCVVLDSMTHNFSADRSSFAAMS